MIDTPPNNIIDSSHISASSLNNSANLHTINNNNNPNLNRNNFLQNRSTLLQNLHSLHNLDPTPQDINQDFLYSPSNFSNQLLHIASQNIRGLSDPTKQQHVLNIVNMRKIDIMGFSETNLSHNLAPHVFNNLSNYHAIFHSHKTHPHGSGVGLLIHQDYARFIHKVNYFEGRVISVDFLMKGKSKLRIIQLYTPVTSSPTNTALRQIADNYVLNLLDQSNRAHFQTVLMGDFNVNALKLIQRKETNLLPKADQFFLDTLPTKLLCDAHLSMHPNIDDDPVFNTYFDDPNSTHGSSRLDYQWLSFSLLPSIYKSMTWPNDPIFYSTDHKMLSLVLDTNELFHNSSTAYRAQHDLSRTVFNYRETTAEKWNLFANDTDSFLQLDPRFSEATHLSQHDINRTWDLIRTVILKASKNSLPTKKIHSNFGRKFPEQLSRIQAHLTLITNLLRNFSNQKIIRSIYPSTGKLTQLRTRLPPLTKEYVHQDILLPDDTSSFTKSIMESLRTSLYQFKN